MSDVMDDAVSELARARDLAIEASRDLRQKKRDPRDRGDYEAYDRYATAYVAALEAEDKATKRLIAGLANPQGEHVRKLADAIDELNDRLERLRQSAAALNEVATAITMLTHAILLFTML